MRAWYITQAFLDFMSVTEFLGLGSDGKPRGGKELQKRCQLRYISFSQAIRGILAMGDQARDATTSSHL